MDALRLFLPETLVLVGALLTLLMSVAGRGLTATRWTATVALVAAGVASMATLGEVGEPFFPGIYGVDLFTQLLKTGMTLGTAVTLLLLARPGTLREDARSDVPFFFLLSTAGMMMLVSARELLTLYVTLELSAYGLYVVVALNRDLRVAGESGAKYILFGGAASALTLYGIGLVYGMAGTTYLSGVAAAVGSAPPPLLVVGLLFILAALFFKLAVAPFHFWAPDVYEGAPHPVVAFVATTSKLAAVGIIARVVSVLASGPGMMVPALVLLSAVSMTLGNLAALAQSDVKRLLGYSAVAHAGYLLLGYLTFSEVGIAAAVFYGIVYLAMALLAFVVVSAVGVDGENPSVASLAGLWQRSPAAALLLLVALFGLAGIPPTAGFAGKWFLFSAALSEGRFWLVLFAAVNSTVSLYYYLQVVRAVYLDPADGRPPVVLGPGHAIAGVVAAAVTVGVGVAPGPLWELARRAAGALLVNGGM
jgi:NADH-quinone oxidoreductase subunit N